jgi:di/tricarboxylate transporter
VLLVFPDLAGGSDSFGRATGAVVIAVGLWATAAVPPYYTSLLFMLLAVGLAIAPASVVFSGFHSTAVWLVFGGIVLGLAVRSSGLGDRLVQAMLQRFPLSYPGLVFALSFTGVALGFVIPSAAGRVLILMPVVLALAERMNFSAGSNGRTGMVLAAGLGTTIPSFAILPANVPNLALAGAAESIHKINFTYGEYLLLNFTVMGVLAALAIPSIICRVFPDTPGERKTVSEVSPWTGGERKLVVVLAFGLGLWATDFLHGISPAWVAMAAALVIMAPRIGVLPPTVVANKLEYGPWFFVAGIIGLGAVVNHTGLGAEIARQIFAVVPLSPGDGPFNFLALWGVGAVASLLTTLPAAPGILTPLAEGMAQASGWPLTSVLMTQVPVWIIFALPYQAPPIIVALALGGVSPTKALRVMLPYFAFGVVIMLPLQYLWGHLLGVYP